MENQFEVKLVETGGLLSPASSRNTKKEHFLIKAEQFFGIYLRRSHVKLTTRK